ncbi:MAG: hypothetical protein V4692_08610 [Bdellovibrionota bacterium]
MEFFLLVVFRVLFLLCLVAPLSALAADPSSIITPPFTGAKEGGAVYRTCFYCHSLKPGVHLTGPSLANLWGKKAGQVEGFELYSNALKKSGIVWNEKSLKAFVANPAAKVPGTTMTFAGVKHSVSVDGMVDFLKIAMGPQGYSKVIEQDLATAELADGQLPRDLSKPSEKDRVVEIIHCGKYYSITTADKKRTRHWELNLEFKVNSGERGPVAGKPVRYETGSMGDRYAIVFHGADEIGKMIKGCEAPGL